MKRKIFLYIFPLQKKVPLSLSRITPVQQCIFEWKVSSWEE